MRLNTLRLQTAELSIANGSCRDCSRQQQYISPQSRTVTVPSLTASSPPGLPPPGRLPEAGRGLHLDVVAARGCAEFPLLSVRHAALLPFLHWLRMCSRPADTCGPAMLRYGAAFKDCGKHSNSAELRKNNYILVEDLEHLCFV
ncbi:hypothetical protein KUCAC02_001425 [Chaenocephalus aceratus]|uniref:Uncharacterized protein n=1 Tax=Chaenocephalus aceratus TaxID=36190 RepID=A0ACB9XSV3_CHAAC|nr:hypothetical protein KUCAC02_001425 [Chaenocephalus aceratus]